MKVPPYRPSLLFDELGLEPYHICLEEKDAGELDETFYKIHDELLRR
jgi:hypothetical protein